MSPLDDIRALVESAPNGDLAAKQAAEDRQKRLMQAPGGLGRMSEIVAWMAQWQGTPIPKVERPMVAIYASSHGVAKHGIVSHDKASTQKMVEMLRTGAAATNHIAAAGGAGLRVFEMAVEKPTADFTEGPAMSEKETAATIAFGMEAIAEKPDLLVLGETGVGGGTAAAAVACAMFGGNATYWVRAGAWVSSEVIDARVEVVRKAMATHRGNLSNPLEILRRVGGREIAALVGAIIAARMQGIPVILDVFSTCVAAALVHAMKPGAADHCLAGHLSSEPAHQALLDRLGQKPLLDLGLRCSEGAGASATIGLLKAACAANEHAAIGH
ncbi:nicotinate-nucleotide--dimethylbenzimidazole phosphoribosyltransferase [Hirschia baltica]|uniref:Nicotinate-nucleotide--dimethylbenzimidazole phosphoribosyltransferase n=1 Tax=Hirschia baltica (strain ATCC 49814 / DSM 5838 / IFAM 1418) TaxID=582402 RepID=C6XJ31_HIRBI|nr:nicotinate-nucleotide--dimethylbenzimidazole phosphoribosyltransferase [Hirschia baltica]ACT59126.1 Nicotinate-nucleotide--dimethylbenzimidazole phosphoribosyltransferase [Hirschia baltica ATCC 49814]